MKKHKLLHALTGYLLFVAIAPASAQEGLLQGCFQKAEAINAGTQASWSDLESCNPIINAFEQDDSGSFGGYNGLEISASYQNRAIIYTELTHYERAADDLNQALSISPDSLELLLNIGVLNMLQGEYNTAIADFSELLPTEQDIQQDSELVPQALYNRALAYNYSGELELAVSDLLTLQPQYTKHYTVWVTEESLPTLFPLLPELLSIQEEGAATEVL